MTPTETAALIAYIAARLGRTAQPNPLMVEAWHDDLQHATYDEAKAAAQRVTSRPDIISVQVGHLLAEIRAARRPPGQDLDAVIEACDDYYRGTDDNHTLPARDDHSLAARVYRRAGGFAGLHHPQWYRKRLADAYAEVVAEDEHRAMVNDGHALTPAANQPAAIDWDRMGPRP